MVGRTPAASSEPPVERRSSLDHPDRRLSSLDHSDRRLFSPDRSADRRLSGKDMSERRLDMSERSESATPHAQLAMGAMERLAPVLYVRNYRSLRRRIAEKTAPRPSVGRDLPRPSYTPQQRAELRRVYSRSLSRPLPLTASTSVLGGSRGVTPSSESPRTRDATSSTPERQLRRPLLPLWTPADITVRDDPLDVSMMTASVDGCA